MIKRKTQLPQKVNPDRPCTKQVKHSELTGENENIRKTQLNTKNIKHTTAPHNISLLIFDKNKTEKICSLLSKIIETFNEKNCRNVLVNAEMNN